MTGSNASAMPLEIWGMVRGYLEVEGLKTWRGVSRRAQEMCPEYTMGEVEVKGWAEMLGKHGKSVTFKERRSVLQVGNYGTVGKVLEEAGMIWPLWNLSGYTVQFVGPSGVSDPLEKATPLYSLPSRPLLLLLPPHTTTKIVRTPRSSYEPFTTTNNTTVHDLLVKSGARCVSLTPQGDPLVASERLPVQRVLYACETCGN